MLDRPGLIWHFFTASNCDYIKTAAPRAGGFFMRNFRRWLCSGTPNKAEITMSTEKKGTHPVKRLRGPNITTIIAAAANAGRRLVSAVAEPNGSIELKFSEGDSDNRSGRGAIEA
jgi:hypothetical protein